MKHSEALAIIDRLVHTERERAHAKHGITSMRHQGPLDERRYRILVEEVGEVAQVWNDHDHGKVSRQMLADTIIDELVQVAAMASDWAAAIATAKNNGSFD